jgi:hypothetical protein
MAATGRLGGGATGTVPVAVGGSGSAGRWSPGLRYVVLAVVLVAAMLLLAGCAAGANDVAAVGTAKLAGFWLGLWQGIISPITFIVSLFNHHVSIYEVHNNGGWYNFGFMLGVSMVFSGGSGSASRRRRR